jgi:hypothetical protein
LFDVCCLLFYRSEVFLTGESGWFALLCERLVGYPLIGHGVCACWINLDLKGGEVQHPNTALGKKDCSTINLNLIDKRITGSRGTGPRVQKLTISRKEKRMRKTFFPLTKPTTTNPTLTASIYHTIPHSTCKCNFKIDHSSWSAAKRFLFVCFVFWGSQGVTKRKRKRNKTKPNQKKK